MVEYRCEFDDGIAGVAAALARAAAGDCVVVAPGRYETGQTLAIPSGVTLSGWDATIVHDGDGPAIEARGARDVALIGLAIEARTEHTPRRVTPEAPAISDDEDATATEWGIIWFDDVHGGRVESVGVRGCRADRNRRGIVARRSADIAVKACTIAETGGSAVSFWSVAGGVVIDCEVRGSARHAVQLAPSREGSGPCFAFILNNRLHDTSGTGVVLFSSCSGAIEGNDVYGNGEGGVALTSDPVSPDAPSSARVVGNRLHDNGQAGLALASSTSEEIADNDCWGNALSGISMARDKDSPDAPSSARVVGNRLHDNGQAGLVLLSSKSAEIADNDCWGNVLSGIAMERDKGSPDASAARVVGNRLHDNGQAGLVLFSSTSEEIGDNDCWGNALSGIVLQRHENSPDSPSSARVVGNRLHDNGQAGLALFSSTSAEIADNDCWGNALCGISMERSRHGQSSAVFGSNWLINNARALIVEEGGAQLEFAAANVVLGNPEASVWCVRTGHGDLRSTDRPIAPDWLVVPDGFGPLEDWIAERERERLARHSRADLLDAIRTAPAAERLASLIAGSGCAGCLRAWFDVEPDDVDETASAFKAPERQRHVCHASDNPPRIVFAPQEDLDGATRFWNVMRQAVGFGAAAEFRLAIVAAEDDAYRAIPAQIETLRQLISGHLGDRSVLPEPAQAALRVLEETSPYRVAPAVVIDHRARSLKTYSGEASTDGLFDSLLMEGRSMAWERIVALMHSPRFLGQIAGLAVFFFLLAAAVGIAKGFDGQIWRLHMAALHALLNVAENFTLLDVLGSGIVLGGLASLAAMANGNLPRALRLDVVDDNLPRRLPWSRKTKDAVESNIADRNWHRWIARRLFGRGVATIIIRNVSEWSEDDAAELRAALAQRPGNVPAILVVTTPSRELVDRALLTPFTEKAEERRLIGGLDGLELLIDNDGDELSFDNKAGEAPSLSNLLGLEGAAARSDLLPTNLQPWSVTTILPMLILGSSAGFNFSLTRNADTTAANFRDKLEQELLPYAAYFTGNPGFRIDHSGDTENLNRLIDAASASAGVLLTREDRGRLLRMTGGAGTRQMLVDALLEELPVDDCRDYAARLMGCGIVHGFLRAERLLEKTAFTDRSLRGATAALGGAGRLLSEIGRTSAIDPTRTAMLEVRRQTLRHLIATAPAPAEIEARSEASRLYAQAIRLGLAPDADLVTDASEPAAIQTVRDCFRQRVAGAFRPFDALDADYAYAVCLATLRSERRQLGDAAEQLVEEAKRRRRSGRSLAARLENAESKTALARVIDDHEGLGVDLPETIYLVLVRAAENREQQLEAAAILVRHRKAGVVCRGTQKVNRPPRGAPTGRLAAGWETFAEVLRTEAMTELLVRISKELPTVPEADLPDVQLGYFEPLRQLPSRATTGSNEIVELVFGTPGRAEDSDRRVAAGESLM